MCGNFVYILAHFWISYNSLRKKNCTIRAKNNAAPNVQRGMIFDHINDWVTCSPPLRMTFICSFDRTITQSISCRTVLSS